MQEEIILILDFGSQYTHLIKSNLANLGAKSIIEPADLAVKDFQIKYPNLQIKGLILSGGAYSVTQNKIPFDKNWLSKRHPILGICYGHQLLAYIFGGVIEKTHGEYGDEVVKCNSRIPLFHGIDSKSIVWMSHTDSVIQTPEKFVSIASTKDYKNAGIYNETNNIYGLQFHPEVSHTVEGMKIMNNFAFNICKLKKQNSWSPERFTKEMTPVYKKVIGEKNVILGLSGGVDSATLVVFFRSFLKKKQLTAVYINTGFEPSNIQDEVKKLCKVFDIKLLIKDYSENFFTALKGISDPDKKRTIIGNVFIQQFEKIALEEQAQIFVQGTIWSDVIESGVTKYSIIIKPHHNVGGLPKKLNFELCEPFRELLKDQIRNLAGYFGLPESFVERPIFPGPGFAIRVDGEVTREKIEIVRKSTDIIQEIMAKHGLVKNYMGFAIYINVKSSGIRGDMRFTNSYAVVVRIIETKNILTANFSTKAFPLLEEIATRIIKETGTGKVLYDITNKPPSTIDWQ